MTEDEKAVRSATIKEVIDWLDRRSDILDADGDYEDAAALETAWGYLVSEYEQDDK